MSGGSLQLRMFRNAIRDGKSLNFAASIAGMSLTEAKLTLEADAADPPPPRRLRPDRLNTKGQRHGTHS